MYTRPLHHTLDLAEAGGKACSLSVMARLGIPVPPGFVVLDTAFTRFTAAENDDLRWLEEELREQLAAVGAAGYMVRSSAVGEDSAQGSFAGQLQSFICSSGLEDIRRHIIKCWQSYLQPNVQVYQQHAGINLQGMGVVVQELVSPDYAGVLFTQAPCSDDQMLCEYVPGHAEKLVSGQTNPERFSCDRTDGIPDTDLPFSFAELHRTALQLEVHYGLALDIEWLVKDGKTWLVQARPITVQTAASKVFWSNTNVNENYPTALTPLLYSVARDAYYHYFKNLARLLQISDTSVRKLEPDFSNIIGVFGCKMYYNMSSIHRIISFSPFAKLLQKSFDNFVGYQEENRATEQTASWRSRLKFFWCFTRLLQNLSKNVRQFELNADRYHIQTLTAQSLPQLRDCFHAFIEIRMHSWYKASVADFFAMVFHGVLGKFCRHYFPEEQQGIHNTLIQAIPDLVSSKPVTETWNIMQLLLGNRNALGLLASAPPDEFLKEIRQHAEFAVIHAAIDEYLLSWGFRCSGELMLTEPNFAEAPEKFVALLKSYVAQAHTSPAELIRQKNKERLQLIKVLKGKLIWRRGLFFPLGYVESLLFGLLIQLCTKGIACRERVRLKQALLYYRFKTVLVKIGKVFRQQGLLATEQDVFFLKYQELAENLTASDMLPEQLKATVLGRKEQFALNSQQTFPDDFSSRLGFYPSPDQVQVKRRDQPSGPAGLKGLSACGGFVKGRARVLESIMELHKIQPGDILVTRQTDPGWASIFPLISGLVVERGGMLSHGAIVAREFGIPAIVGVPNATALIEDGEEIELNADTGEIYTHAVISPDVYEAAV